MESHIDRSLLVASYLQCLVQGLSFPEGPVFAPDGSLWFVELKAGNLARWHKGELIRVPVGGAPNGAAADSEGRIWFCDSRQNAIRRLDPRSGTIETMADRVSGLPLQKPNDLAFDRAGNLIFTCPGDSREEPTGTVCCLSKNGEVSIVASGLRFPNGLAFIEDGKTLVIAETYLQRLWRGVWDTADCQWHEPQVWIEGVEGKPGPDGMALGADGCLYVAVYGGGGIRAYSPDGRLSAIHEIPGSNPTNCAFDPTGQLGLVVTEAAHGKLWSLPGLGPGSPLHQR